MSYWSAGYWASGYWAGGYWVGGDSEAPMVGSALYADRVVTVIRLGLVRKDGTGIDEFHVSEDYWSPLSLHASSPEIFPIVAEPVSSPRSFDGPMGIRHDVQFVLYGKTHFDRYGRGFVDLLENYQIRNSTAAVLRYAKTQDGPGVALGTGGIRQTLELTGVSWEPESGLVRVNARDTWYDDKDVSKPLDPELPGFADLQEDYRYQRGAIPFGVGAGGQGVIIDAPALASNAEDGTADLFCGFGADGHPIDEIVSFYVRNNHKAVVDTEWLPVAFPATTDAVYGADDLADGGDQHGRHLSLFSRAVGYTPTGSGQILANVIIQLRPSAYWAAFFTGSNNLYSEDAKPFAFGDTSFSGYVQVRPETMQVQPVIAKGDFSGTTAEWFLYMNADGKFAFGISADGAANAVEAVWSFAAFANVWYQIFFWYDAEAKTVNISVDNGTPVSVSTVRNTGTLTETKNSDDDTACYMGLASGASASDFTYNAHHLKITSGDALDDEKQIVYSTGSPKRAYFASNFSPLPEDDTDTYEIRATPASKLLDLEKNGPLQIAYMGGFDNHFEGRIGCTALWKGVISSDVRASVFADSAGKAYEHLTDEDKVEPEEYQLVSWWDMGDLYGTRIDKHGGKNLTTGSDVLSKPGFVTTEIFVDNGEIEVSVYRAKYFTSGDSYAPIGAPISSIKFDPEDISTLFALGYPTYFPIDPIELVKDQPYFIAVEWSNHSDHAHAFRCNYETSEGAVSYSKLYDGKINGWTRQEDIALGLALYTLSDDDGEVIETVAPFHAHYSLALHHGDAPGTVGFPKPTKGLEFKAAVRGITDDGSGTYTGSAAAVIDNPSDLVRFVLREDSVFLGVPSGEVDLTSLSATRSALGTTYDMSFPLDRQIFGDPLIRKINEQSETVLIKSRDGKLTHHRETYHHGAFDYVLTQAALQHELRVLSVVETPLDRVYNDFRINFGVDVLNVPKDPALTRRAESDTFSAVVYLNPEEASQPDDVRKAKLAESQERYGVLQFRADFNCYAADSPAPQAIMDRLADRHCFQTARVTISVPLIDFHAIDLFTKLSTRHVELPLDGGTSERVVWGNDGEEIAWHNAGVPLVWMRLGKLEGQVYALVERDQEIEVTFETQNPF